MYFFFYQIDSKSKNSKSFNLKWNSGKFQKNFQNNNSFLKKIKFKMEKKYECCFYNEEEIKIDNSRMKESQFVKSR